MSDFFDPDEWESKPAPVSHAPVIQTTVAQPAVTAAPVMTSPAAAEPSKGFFELKPVGAAPKIEIAKLEVEPPMPVRMPEPVEIPTDFPAFEAPEGMHVDLSDLPIGEEGSLTRRQIRELERLTGSDVIAATEERRPSFEARLPYDEDMLEQIPELATKANPIVEVEKPDFQPSPGLLIEPVTNSIVIDQVVDLTNYTATVNETGEILTTGSIQIPVNVQEPDTGEITVIQDAASLDAAIQSESGAGFVNSVAPMRVTGVVNAMSKSKVIASNLRRGKSQPYAVLATLVMIVVFGGIVLTALLTKII